jgi:multiple sugar transport system ATP-binding protein
VGTPQQIYEDPVSSFVASRLGSPRINLLPRALLGGLAAPPQAVTVGVRAEHVRLHAGGNGHRGAQVRRIERLSDQHLLHLGLNDSEQELVTAAPPGASFATGDEVGVELLRPLWFDADGQRLVA